MSNERRISRLEREVRNLNALVLVLGERNPLSMEEQKRAIELAERMATNERMIADLEASFSQKLEATRP
jgi:hypothetical protein